MIRVKFSFKTLLIGFGLLALVWALLHGVDQSIQASRTEAAINQRVGPRASDSWMNESKRQRLKRARRLSSLEAQEFLKQTIIPDYSIEHTALREALEILDAKIAEQTPHDQPRPRLFIDKNYESYMSSALSGLEDGPGIVEIRVRDIPAQSILNYISDATTLQHWFYRGDVYFGGVFDDGSEFFTTVAFDEIEAIDVRTDQLGKTLNRYVSEVDYYGLKKDIEVVMTEKARNALLTGETSLPSVDLNLEHATLLEVMIAIIRQGGGELKIDQLGTILFDPFNEFEAGDQNANPFDTPPSGGNPFIVPLDENWQTWERPKIEVKYFSTSQGDVIEWRLPE